MPIQWKLATLPTLIASLLTVTTGLYVSDLNADSLSDKERELLLREQVLQEREQMFEAKLNAMTTSGEDIGNALPEAKPGQCFAKVLAPASYKTVTERVVVKEASNKIEVIPAVYKTEQERVLVKESSEQFIEIPAVYENVIKRVLVEPTKTLWRTGKDAKSKVAPADWVSAAILSGVPKKAEIGQCYVEYYQAAKYNIVKERIVKREAESQIQVIPAKYEWIEQKVVVKEASEKIIDIPAVYETIQEQVLERAAYSTWKKGRGPIERIDNSTGDIMCLVEVPAKYKTVTKKVLVTPASTRTVTIPAEYKMIRIQKLMAAAQEKMIEVPATYQTITKKIKEHDDVIGWRPSGTMGDGELSGKKMCFTETEAKYQTITQSVLKTPMRTKKVQIPAEYKAMSVRKIIRPAQTKKIEIPAAYQTVSKRIKITDEKLAWRPVLCETNTSPGLLTEIQHALKNAGFDPGPIDGFLGKQTQEALDAFQRAKGLERGGVTLHTLSVLGLKVDQ